MTDFFQPADVNSWFLPMAIALAALIVSVAVLTPGVALVRRVTALVLLSAAAFLLLFPETVGGRTLLADKFRIERRATAFDGGPEPNVNIDTGRRRIWIMVALLAAAGVAVAGFGRSPRSTSLSEDRV